MIRLGSGVLKVREFAIVFPFGLPRLGRAEDKSNKISRTFNTHLPSLYMSQKSIEPTTFGMEGGHSTSQLFHRSCLEGR